MPLRTLSKLLLAAAEQTDVPVYVVITMRSDFIGDCMEYPGLPEAINHGQYLVPRLSREELRQAIVGPVGVAGGRVAVVAGARAVDRHAGARTRGTAVGRGAGVQIVTGPAFVGRGQDVTVAVGPVGVVAPFTFAPGPVERGNALTRDGQAKQVVPAIVELRLAGQQHLAGGLWPPATICPRNK